MSAIDVFNSQCALEFQFLIDEFGFVRTADTPPDKWGHARHRYEHGDWFINPVYNTREKTIDVEFGNTEYREKPLMLHMYMRLVNPQIYYQLGFAITHSESEIRSLLALYVMALRTSGARILRCDNKVCIEMKRAMRLGEGMCPSYGQQPTNLRIVSPYV